MIKKIHKLGVHWDLPSEPEETIYAPDGALLYIRASTGELVHRSEIELILKKGFNPLAIPNHGEVSHWHRGHKLVKRAQKLKRGTQIPSNYDPVELLMNLRYSRNDAIFILDETGVDQLLTEGAREARMWSSAVTPSQGSLILLNAEQTAKLLVEVPKLADHYLLLTEAIVNNRVTKASHLEAFATVVKKIQDGTSEWKDFRGGIEYEEARENTEYLYSMHESYLIHLTMLRHISRNLFKWRGIKPAKLTEEHWQKFERLVEIYVNNYNRIYLKAVPLIAEAIAKCVIRNKNDINTVHSYIDKYSLAGITISELQREVERCQE